VPDPQVLEVLTTLQNIYSQGSSHNPSGPVQEGTEQLVAARLANGHRIAVYGNDNENNNEEEEEEEEDAILFWARRHTVFIHITMI